MNDEIFYNSLAISLEVNYGKLAELNSEFANWEGAWTNLQASKKRLVDPEKEWQRLERLGLHLLLRGSPGYPEHLREIPHSPFGIYILGTLPKTDPALAIVGTRKATAEGKETARRFAAELAGNGLTIVSGLALGIDAAAHQGCLDAKGITVAVLGNGLGSIYPRTNEGLAKKIIESGGAIVSEYPLGTPSLPYRFLERNRIVSGLARGVLIVEAPEESGALNTARYALDQNREVFVIPGQISHANFVGSNKLIRAGAELVTSPAEILSSLGIEISRETDIKKLPDSEEEKLVWDVLKKLGKPATVDKIAELTKLESFRVSRALTFLILKNYAKEADGGYTI